LGKKKSETLAIFEEAHKHKTCHAVIPTAPVARENQLSHQYLKKTVVDVPILFVLGRKLYVPTENNRV
jgi:hypothetical protein